MDAKDAIRVLMRQVHDEADLNLDIGDVDIWTEPILPNEPMPAGHCTAGGDGAWDVFHDQGGPHDYLIGMHRKCNVCNGLAIIGIHDEREASPR